MANTFVQIYVHVVFSVRTREHVLPMIQKDRLHQYIGGILRKKRHKLFAINSMPDHIHMLISVNPEQSISAMVRDIKTGSSLFINEQKWIHGKFHWQEGYVAFTYSHSQTGVVARYIENQDKHHRKKSFHQEYLDMLENYHVPFDPKYVFDLSANSI